MKHKTSIRGIEYVMNDKRKYEYPELLNDRAIESVRNFHMTLNEYKATPLVELNDLAKRLGVKNIFVKDESHRFGLNAFKALGATYAVAKLLCEKLNIDINEASFDYFMNAEVHEVIKDMVFVTATDGNHGRGLAWAVNKLGCQSVVFMPKGSSKVRLRAIKDAGATASITDLNYDDAVRHALKYADEHGGIMVQDTAWEGYEKIPNWITQGYATMANESYEQLRLEGCRRPTHIFLQAGVGSMAGAVLGYYANVFKEKCPNTIIVEPEKANCIYKSALINDGKPHNVTGDLNTIMAGLACGEPNPITWEILRDLGCAYVSCPDLVSAQGTRVLANPVGSDKRIIAGESGSVGIGLLSIILGDEGCISFRDDLGLDEHSIILCFNTEGDTDPYHYDQIVYQGKNSSYE